MRISRYFSTFNIRNFNKIVFRLIKRNISVRIETFLTDILKFFSRNPQQMYILSTAFHTFKKAKAYSLMTGESSRHSTEVYIVPVTPP